MNVRDIMKQPVIACSIDSNLHRAASLMWDGDCGSIPVVDRDGRLAGIVTDRDICMAAHFRGEPLQSIPVTTAMSHHVLACHVDDSVQTAEELMQEGQVRRVPIIDNDGRPIGIVSMSDLTRAAAESRKNGAEREVIQTLAIISTPRTVIAQVKADRGAGLYRPA